MEKVFELLTPDQIKLIAGWLLYKRADQLS
jgi:hypothetical protein